MTEPQKRLFDFIVSYRATNEYSPSLQEMANEMGIASLTGVQGHLNKLVRKGKIRITKGIARSVIPNNNL